MILRYLILTLFISTFSAFAQDASKKSDSDTFVDFNSIKDVLQNDMLSDEAARKQAEEKKASEEKFKKEVGRYNIPSSEEFWSFFSEYWLVKNAPIIKWDFKKPDYGIEVAFESFLEKLGHYEKKFKILMVNTPSIYHMALPTNDGELLFILSVPFIRTLDLSKLEISLLLYEDYLRSKMGYFSKYVSTKGLEKSLGSNFHQKKFDKKLIKDVLNKYDEIIYTKGFNFQQQFEITKQMNSILKADLKIWNIYLKLLGKIDTLVKSNILYQNYVKIFPSPEMQINWLSPKKKNSL